MINAGLRIGDARVASVYRDMREVGYVPSREVVRVVGEAFPEIVGEGRGRLTVRPELLESMMLCVVAEDAQTARVTTRRGSPVKNAKSDLSST